MFDEDRSAFLQDFGVIAEFESMQCMVILDVEDELLLGERVQSTKYRITFKPEDLLELAHGKPITVDGEQYSVLTVDSIDDGKFKIAALQKP